MVIRGKDPQVAKRIKEIVQQEEQNKGEVAYRIGEIEAKNITIEQVGKHISNIQVINAIQQVNHQLGNQQLAAHEVVIEKRISASETNDTLKIRVPKQIAETIVDEGQIEIGEKNYETNIFIEFTGCYNCQNLTHTAAMCRQKTRCVRCAEEHNVRNCTARWPNCANCTFYKMTHRNRKVDTNHQADSTQCPCQKMLIHKYRRLRRNPRVEEIQDFFETDPQERKREYKREDRIERRDHRRSDRARPSRWEKQSEKREGDREADWQERRQYNWKETRTQTHREENKRPQRGEKWEKRGKDKWRIEQQETTRKEWKEERAKEQDETAGQKECGSKIGEETGWNTDEWKKKG